MAVPSPVVAADRTHQFQGRPLKYSPLTYKQRGHLENFYFPAFKTPYARYLDELAELEQDPYWAELPPESHEQIEANKRDLRGMSLGVKPHLETDDAKRFFLEDHLSDFVSVVFAHVPNLDFAAVADHMTKGQAEDMWDYCLEVGDYLPKSSSRAASRLG